MTKKAKKVARPAKAAILRPTASVIIRATTLECLEIAMSRTADAVVSFDERLRDLLVESEQVRQDDLAAVALFSKVSKESGRPADAFSKLMKNRLFALEEQANKDGGPKPTRLPNVEIGTRVLTFEDNRRVSVSWKDEAIKHAQILHAVATAMADGDMRSVSTLLAPFTGAFDANRWEAAIKAGKPKAGELTPKIVGD